MKYQKAERNTLKGEVWADIPFTKGHYSISTYCRLYNNKHHRFLNKFVYRNGYEYVFLYQKHYFIHRLMAHTFMGLDINSPLVINHLDANKSNNSLSNLEITTHYGNAYHAWKNGLLKGASWDVSNESILGVVPKRLRFAVNKVLKISHGEFERQTGVSRKIFYARYNGIKQETIDKIIKAFPLNPTWIKDGIGDVLLKPIEANE